MHCLCDKCKKLFAFVLLVLGVLFILRDLNVWNFWNIQWWSALILLFGLIACCANHCPACKDVCKTPKKKK